ncbi:glycoside hydrolase family 15 protein [Halosimplex salinum]|uniref:glycoside hydrolase family 15 protein n=1 Tax=Halosimplex salinum TaxID=1710538 RepID=UPI000F4ADE8B|nr:glycoside hydrolase family 15 protein [Halosimplex salinum]
MTEDRYTPIEEYGLVGNLETCALVAPNGSVDWFPFPHVESPSILGAILDDDAGGRFRIGPVDGSEGTQAYVDGTNVLETTFATVGGTATVTDFLPPAGRVDHPKKVLYRKVACTEGAVDLAVAFEPRFDYARAETAMTETDRGIFAEGAEERTLLESPVDLSIDGERATGTLSLDDGESAWFMLRCTGAEDASTDPDAALAETVDYWTDWVHDCGESGDDGGSGEGECAFGGPWHDLVVRSGLVLKLLTHGETGAMAAAPTTSLPEDIGGVRNWDYRYNWVRDAGFSIQALLNLGHVAEAADYFEWFLELCHADEPAEIRPLYGLHGDSDLTERELDHLDGYRDSRPVRVGNGAAGQTQLDIYGELLLAVDEMRCHGRALGSDDWAAVREIVDYVVEVWDRRDAGIWEVRGGPEHFVYSKVMCWAALDRGIAIATETDHEAPLSSWRDARERIRADVIERGYDEEIGAFVQSYGSETLDATGLLLPVVGFLPFGDERVQGTIDAVEDRLVEDEVLVRRYDGDDGLPGSEGAFVLCSCWLIDALALGGRADEACERFEALQSYVGPLGLVAEELDVETGHHLGNYPQAFSHIGIINSALYVGFAEGRETDGPPPMGVRLGDPVAPEES